MSRDTKPKKSVHHKKSGGGTLLGMFIGLVLGVVIAAGVVWYMNQAPVPFVTRIQAPQLATAPNQPPMALPGKPGDPVPEKRFQFYDILPGKAEAVPDKSGETKTTAETKPAAPENKPTPITPKPQEGMEAKKEEPKKEEPKKEEAKKEEPKKEEPRKEEKPHFLQAGAFSRAQDADNLKANLAMMGLEANVQQVMVQDRTFYRLRLGPYTKIEDANKVRSELAKAGVDTTLLSKE